MMRHQPEVPRKQMTYSRHSSSSSSSSRIGFTAICLLVWLGLLHCCGTVGAVRKLQVAIPLQSLTIWDPEVREESSSALGTSLRSRFLAKFRLGLSAEIKARQDLLREKSLGTNTDTGAPRSSAIDVKSKNWASQAAAIDRQQRLAQERIVEEAYDKAVALLPNIRKEDSKSLRQNRNPNQYQFVGVINPIPAPSSAESAALKKPPITWYARPKPPTAKWSVRLVHVNRDAILKDLYNRGKIDILARYDNTQEFDATTNQPIVTSQYIVRERSWRNLWNFSPKHVFTDSSGMYWRERRLSPGLYTDGQSVYEASYRYRDGRNGMHKLSSFSDFINSRSIDSAKKTRIQKRLSEDTPDVVLEE